MANWVDETVAQFGRSIGMEGLALNRQRVLAVEIEAAGTLFIEALQASVLVYLARHVPPSGSGIAARALEACNDLSFAPYVINPAMKGSEWMIFVARIPEQDFALPTLEEVIAQLIELQEGVA